MEKINIAEVLKDCPKGMELYSPLCGECRVIKVYDSSGFDVINGTDDVFTFYYDGRYNIMGECCIFPSKENMDWSKFQRPFEEGDIIYNRLQKRICIYYTYGDEIPRIKYCRYNESNAQFEKLDYPIPITIQDYRLATEEEKEKLFKAIKDNGYKWNEETKTLVKWVKPKFKVGDIIQYVDTYKVKITEVSIEDECYGFESMIAKGIGSIPFSEQNNWKLISNKFDITTLVPFESRVLMRSSNAREWVGTIYSHYSNSKFYGCGMCCDQCIPYEGNEHLIGKTDDCDEFYKTW